MQEIIDIFTTYGPYIGLPVIIAFLTQGLKKQVPFFQTLLGLRFIHFLPLLLGILGGLLLPEDTWQSKLLVGGGLGSLSLFLYKVVTVSMASKAKLAAKLGEEVVDEDAENL